MRRFGVVSVHPRFIGAYAAFGTFRAAAAKGLAEVDAIDLRDYAVDKHGSVDDHPYGGGDGMVLRPEPLADALKAYEAKLGEAPHVILTSPAGKLWTQREAEALAAAPPRPVLFVCGRFGGVDQRFIDRYVAAEYSCGDVILSGGELPALMMIDSVLRLIPGVLGHAESSALDSFAAALDGGLEFPLYTRPPEFEGVGVPSVLMSGDHAKIEAWRRAESRARTQARRPDLLR